LHLSPLLFVSSFLLRETIFDSKSEFRTTQNEQNASPKKRKESALIQARRDRQDLTEIKIRNERNKGGERKKVNEFANSTDHCVVINA